MRAVSNAGPLIHLSWIDLLDVLPRLFDEVLTPIAVQDEVLAGSADVPGMVALRAAFGSGWLLVRRVTYSQRVAELRTTLDRGESESIVLMAESRADILLLDDRLARPRDRRWLHHHRDHRHLALSARTLPCPIGSPAAGSTSWERLLAERRSCTAHPRGGDHRLTFVRPP